MPFKFAITLIAAMLMAAPAWAAEAKYQPINIQNISKALFKAGALRASDPLAVHEYIRIHHCDLYEQYGSDDVAWTRLREAQARELGLIVPAFSQNVEVEGSLILGDYDFATSSFAIRPDKALKNMGIVTVMDIDNGRYEPCGSDYSNFVPRAHPMRLSSRLSVPLTLTSISVPRNVADQMIKIINNRVNDDHRRSVLLVLSIHLDGPDPLAGSADPSSLTLTGDLDKFEIYDGPERKLLLHKKVFIDPSVKENDRQ